MPVPSSRARVWDVYGSAVRVTVIDVLTDPKLTRSAIVESGWSPEIHVLPASRILAARDREKFRNTELRLRRALNEVKNDYKLVLIDTPPSLGPNTLSALGASDFVLIVIELATHSLRGLTAVLDTIDDVWAELNPDLDFAGVLPNRVPPVSSEADRRFDELAEMVGRKAICVRFRAHGCPADSRCWRPAGSARSSPPIVSRCAWCCYRARHPHNRKTAVRLTDGEHGSMRTSRRASDQRPDWTTHDHACPDAERLPGHERSAK